MEHMLHTTNRGVMGMARFNRAKWFRPLLFVCFVSLIVFFSATSSISEHSVASSDIIVVNFNKTEANSGELLSIPYEITDPNAKVISFFWHSPQQGQYFYPADPTNLSSVFEFYPVYAGESYLEINVQTGDGSIVTKRLPSIYIHGINIELTFGIDSHQLNVGDVQTIDYVITGGSGNYDVTTNWDVYFGNPATSSSVSLDTTHNNSAEGRMSLSITGSMTYVNFMIYVTDDHGSIALKNIGSSWEIVGGQSEQQPDPSDIIIVTFNQTEANSGELLRIPYKITDPNARILSFFWQSPQQGQYFYPSDPSALESVFEFYPVYSGKSYLEINIQAGDGSVVQKRLPDIYIHGIEIEIQFGINARQLNVGDVQTIDYYITGGTGNYSITTNWDVYFGNPASTSSVSLDTTTSSSPEGKMSLQITDTMTYVNFMIYVTDDKGSIALKNIGSSWEVVNQIVNIFILPGNLKIIEDNAFDGITAQKVEIQDGCTSIGSEAFANCRRLRMIRIPSSVTKIDDTAFSGCTNLTIYGSSNESKRIADLYGFTYKSVNYWTSN